MKRVVALMILIGCSGGASEPDTDLQPYQSASCEQMLICDQVLTEAGRQDEAFFTGVSDPDFGTGGACFDEDPAACDAACDDLVDAFVMHIDYLKDSTTIDEREWAALRTDCGTSS